ncbi:MAG: hypothetical protein INQ03_09340 [Candidatus Heimdallarchaeota archaeon]|nr:hypothetical protein [Candidatus Heimdallarchaeota archaeon]
MMQLAQGEDVKYLLNILKPQICNELMQSRDLGAFSEYTQLKYIHNLTDYNNNIFLKILNIKSSRKVTTCIVCDAQGDTINLLLWDQLIPQLQEQQIGANEIIFITNANVRLSKNEKILNAGSKSKMEVVTDFINPKAFNHESEPNFSKINQISGQLTNIQGKVIGIVDKHTSYGPLVEVTVEDNTGKAVVEFWGEWAELGKSLDKREVQLFNLRVRLSNIIQLSYTPSSNLIYLDGEIKKTQVTGIITSIPLLIEGWWYFTLQDGLGEYYLVISKEIIFSITDYIRLNNVEIKKTGREDYKYEVYVTPESDMEYAD